MQIQVHRQPGVAAGLQGEPGRLQGVVHARCAVVPGPPTRTFNVSPRRCGPAWAAAAEISATARSTAVRGMRVGQQRVPQVIVRRFQAQNQASHDAGARGLRHAPHRRGDDAVFPRFQRNLSHAGQRRGPRRISSSKSTGISTGFSSEPELYSTRCATSGSTRR